MAKQLNISMSVQADTSQARAQFQQLEQSLKKIGNASVGKGKFTQDIKDASNAANQLRSNLESAFNVDTGKLDLSKLSRAMKTSGMDLQQYRLQLSKCGQEGEQAFVQLAKSIQQAEIPLRRSSKMLDNFATSLKNTARWQISSSVLHGFMGALNSAVGYAKDLDSSLNSIRIVTGQTSDQMAKFAQQANAAAKALSTTTTAYTDAALIFYQQGLDDSAVKARTDAVIKMANVTGDAADQVSSYMTAIWNNFDDGSQSLEHYADVITALGASTASSSAEIAAGLEKFAAIADVTGLSYEYATSALATLVANTRQSADVVGTSLKTIFSRLEGVNLGETLDDGVDLNKYSGALKKIGVDILDVNGEMKDLDTILEDMASKWDNLTNAQKMATAQTVAGVRQYNNLISLMDNWDDMETNLHTANNANGSLQDQADIYAESWEAARKRVKAAAEELYGDLLDPEFFTELDNMLVKIIETVDGLVDSLGGVSGVLTTIAALSMKAFGDQMAQGLRNIAYSVGGKEQYQNFQISAAQEMQHLAGSTDSAVTATTSDEYAKIGALQEKLLKNSKDMTQEEIKQAQYALERQETYAETVKKTAEQVDKERKISDQLEVQAKKAAQKNGRGADFSKYYNDLQKTAKGYKELSISIQKYGKDSDQAKAAAEKLGLAITKESDADIVLQQAFDKLVVAEEEFQKVTGQSAEKVEQMSDQAMSVVSSETAMEAAIKASGDAAEEASAKMEHNKNVSHDWAEQVVAISGGITSLMSGLQSLGSIITTVTNPDLSPLEKAERILMSLAMGIPMVVTGVQALAKAQEEHALATISDAVANTSLFGSLAALITGHAGNVAAMTAEEVAEAGLTATQLTLNAAMYACPLVWIIGLVMALIAAIALLAVGIAAIIKAIENNSAEGKLKKAQQHAEDMAKAAEEAKNRFNDLLNAFKEYDTVVNKLEECTKGTQEWNEALKEVNNQVLEMLQQFPELSKYVERDATTGALSFAEGTEDLVLKAAEQRMNSATYASIMANAQVAEAKANVQRSNLSSDVSGYFYQGDYFDSASYNKFMDNLDELAGLTEDEYKAKLKELGLTESLVKYQDDVDSLVIATRDAAEQISNVGKIVANNELGDEYDDSEKLMAGASYNQLYDDIYDELIKKSHKNQQIDKHGSTGEELMDRYFAATGINGSYASNMVQGTDSNRVYEYLDENGKTSQVSEETLASTVAAYEALQKLEGAAANAAESLQKMEDKIGDTSVGNGMRNFVASHNFESMTADDFAKLKAQIDATDINGVTGTEAYLDSIIGDGKDGKISDDTAIKYGFNNAEEMVKAFDKAMEDYDTALDTFTDSLIYDARDAFKELKNTGGLSVTAGKAIGQLLEDAFLNGDGEGMTDFLSSLSAGDLADFAEMAQGIDWTNMSLSEFKDSLDQAGIYTNLSDEELQKLIKTMRGDGIKAINELTDSFGKMFSVVDGLKDGDSISADDYANLNDQAKSFFMMMEDGTYKLVGQAKDLQNLIHGQANQAFRDNIQGYKDKNADLASLKGMDFDGLSGAQFTDDTKAYYSGANVQDQLKILSAMGYDPEQIQHWQDDLSDSESTVGVIEDIANAVDELNLSEEQLNELMQQNNDMIEANMEALAGASQSIAQLNGYLADGTISAAAYDKALDAVTQTEATIHDLDFDDIVDQGEALAKAFNLDAAAGRQLAIENQRMNRGVSNLVDNLDKWKKGLNETDKTSMDYIDTIQEMSSCVADLVGAEEDLKLSGDFIENNMDLIEEAAKGSEDAINRLGIEVAKFKIEAMENPIDPSTINSAWDAQQYQQFETWKNTILSGLDELQASLDSLSVGDNVFDTMGGDDWVNALNAMAMETQMSVDEMNALLNSMGVQAEVSTTWQEQTVKVPEYHTKRNYLHYDDNGNPDEWTETTTQTGYQEMKGGVDVAQINTGENVGKKPTITYTGNGTVSSSAKQGSKGGGGGGGKSKEKSKKDEKKISDEVDRYHEIKEVLQDISTELNRASKATDRAFGAGKVANINRETTALYQQVDALKEYQSQVLANLEADKAAAQAAGWTFGPDGNVVNYEGTLAALMNTYNAAVQQYNAAAAGSDAEKAAQENLEAAEKTYEAAKKALDTYEATKDLYDQVSDQITDTLYQIQDKELQKLEYIIDFKFEIDDAQMKYLEELMKNFGDSADHALDKIANLTQGINQLFETAGDAENALNKMLDFAGAGNIYSDPESIAAILSDPNSEKNMSQIVDDLQSYTDKLYDINEQLRTYREQVYTIMEDAMAEFIEDLDRANSKLEHVKTLTQGYKDIIETVGKANIDATGKLTKQLNEALQHESENAYKAALAKQEYAQNQLLAAQDAYNTAMASKDEYAIERCKAILKQAEDDLATAQEESQGKMQEWAEAIAQTFADEIAQVIEDLNDALGDLRGLREQFDQSKEINSEYLEDYEKIYQLSKLTRDVQKSIDDNDSINAKRTLMEFQKQIAEYQKDGVKMSQYELEYLQKKYELELARIAMEEAQNAKSQVTMTRDSEGNYSYVYTADDQAVADAQQKYEDKLHEMQVLNGQYINELQENLIAMQEEMSAKLQEIADDDALSYEEKQAKMAEVTDYYLHRINYFSEQLELVLENNNFLYENDWRNYSAKTGYKISANEDYVDSWEETTLAILTNVQDQSEYLRQLQDAITEAKEHAQQACKDAEEALNYAGLCTELFGDKVQNELKDLERESDEAARSAEDMARRYSSAISEIGSSVSNFNTYYAGMIQNMINHNQQLINSMNQVMQAAYSMMAALGASSGKGHTSGSGYLGNPNNTVDKATANTTPAVNIGSIAEGIAGNIWVYGDWGNGNMRKDLINQYGGENGTAIYNEVQSMFNSGYGYNGGLQHDWDYYKQFSPSKIASLDTGGYTGEWGGLGKLAMLHEKELVLNADDTANMLQMIDMVRSISNAIDLNALSAMASNGLQAVTATLSNNETLEQEVHITAEFPNATNKQEILDAFDNVINLAAQYANRK